MANSGQAILQALEVGVVLGASAELIAERCFGTEDLVVDERNESLEFEQRILQRGCGEQELRPISDCGTDLPGGFVPRFVDVAEAVRLIDDGQVPRDRLHVCQFGTHELVRDDEDPFGTVKGLACPAFFAWL